MGDPLRRARPQPRGILKLGLVLYVPYWIHNLGPLVNLTSTVMHPKDNRRRTLKVLGLVGVSLFTLILQSVGTFHVLRYSEERKITGNDRQYCEYAVLDSNRILKG